MISFKGAQYPKSVILYAVYFYARFPVSYRDLEEIMAERGVEVDHATLNRWVGKYAGALAEMAQDAGAELWLDGGHNAAAGQALASVLAAGPVRPTHLICGMLNTKDITGYLRPLAAHAKSLHAVSIPGEAATLPAHETAKAARVVGMTAYEAQNVGVALNEITSNDPEARVLICGSLYLAGAVLRENE